MSVTIKQLSENDPTKFSVGDYVIYSPYPGGEERGVVTAVGDRYVHVRYEGDEGAKATDPWMLTPEFQDIPPTMWEEQENKQ